MKLLYQHHKALNSVTGQGWTWKPQLGNCLFFRGPMCLNLLYLGHPNVSRLRPGMFSFVSTSFSTCPPLYLITVFFQLLQTLYTSCIPCVSGAKTLVLLISPKWNRDRPWTPPCLKWIKCFCFEIVSYVRWFVPGNWWRSGPPSNPWVYDTMERRRWTPFSLFFFLINTRLRSQSS